MFDVLDRLLHVGDRLCRNLLPLHVGDRLLHVGDRLLHVGDRLLHADDRLVVLVDRLLLREHIAGQPGDLLLQFRELQPHIDRRFNRRLR